MSSLQDLHMKCEDRVSRRVTKMRTKFGRFSNADDLNNWDCEAFKQAYVQTMKNEYMRSLRQLDFIPSVNRKQLDKDLLEYDRMSDARDWAVTISPPKETITRRTFSDLKVAMSRQGKFSIKWYPAKSMDGHEHIHALFHIKTGKECAFRSDILRLLKGKPIVSDTIRACIKIDPLVKKRDVDRWVDYCEDPAQNEILEL